MDTEHARSQMVEQQLAGRGIADANVLAAMGRVPREAFVPEALRDRAYRDCALPIAEGQTISQPYMVAFMIEAAAVPAGGRVLEIGTGSGYAAAVLAQIAAEVYTIEWYPPLATEAEQRFQRLGYRNVHVRQGDGSLGWPEAAPFDSIVVSAGAPAAPEALKRQLVVGGRLVVPVGATRHFQTLLRITRTVEDAYEEDRMGEVAFVPLLGEEGWSDDGRHGDMGMRF